MKQFNWLVVLHTFLVLIINTNKYYNFYNNICEKMSIQYQYRDSNPRPLGRESPRIATIPGLPPSFSQRTTLMIDLIRRKKHISEKQILASNLLAARPVLDRRSSHTGVVTAFGACQGAGRRVSHIGLSPRSAQVHTAQPV